MVSFPDQLGYEYGYGYGIEYGNEVAHRIVYGLQSILALFPTFNALLRGSNPCPVPRTIFDWLEYAKTDIKWIRPSPSIFAYCKQSKNEGGKAWEQGQCPIRTTAVIS